VCVKKVHRHAWCRRYSRFPAREERELAGFYMAAHYYFIVQRLERPGITDDVVVDGEHVFTSSKEQEQISVRTGRSGC
jgi:hypothetical protein